MRIRLAAAATAGLLVLVPTSAMADSGPAAPAATVAASADNGDDGGDNGLWGLVGLLGLAGLAGLKRREPDHRPVDRTTPSR